MTRSRGREPLLALATMLLLCACGSPEVQSSDPTPSPYLAVARGRIEVEGGLLSVVAPREGRIARVRVREGETVRRGAPLLELDDTAARLAIRAAEAAAAEGAAQQRALTVQLVAARARSERLRAAVAAGAGEGQLADDAEAQVQQLVAQGAVLRATEMAADARLSASRHELAMLTVTAPQDAEVIQVTAQVGATVSPAGAALFSLLPALPRIIRAEINEVYVDAVQPGMPATISPEDDPSRQWPAHVVRLSPIVGPARFDDDVQRRGGERSVECVLAFDGDLALRVGQRVLVRIGRR